MSRFVQKWTSALKNPQCIWWVWWNVLISSMQSFRLCSPWVHIMMMSSMTRDHVCIINVKTRKIYLYCIYLFVLLYSFLYWARGVCSRQASWLVVTFSFHIISKHYVRTVYVWLLLHYYCKWRNKWKCHWHQWTFNSASIESTIFVKLHVWPNITHLGSVV